MKNEDISRIRLTNQSIYSRKARTPDELMNHMGAFQAQDYPMAKWAIGLRLRNSSEEIINSAINKGEILRTHLLRPTWHFVAPKDIYWMLELSAAGIKKAMKSRNRELGLTKEIFSKSNRLIRRTLSNNTHLTRQELIAILKREKFNTTENRASHLLMEAELDGIICSGISEGKIITYALLEERVNNYERLNKEHSLKRLAQIYFKSRGPATVYDFSWWSGLNISDSKKATEMVSKEMVSFETDSSLYWMYKESADNSGYSPELLLLPAYDEFLLSYRDRSAAMISDNYKKTISSNGIFRPLIVYRGKIIGIWKRTLKQNSIVLEFNYFRKPAAKIKSLVDNEAERFALFSGRIIRDAAHISEY